jgi:hypothetical protein
MLGMLMAMAVCGIRTYLIMNPNEQDAIEYPYSAVARRWCSSTSSVCTVCALSHRRRFGLMPPNGLLNRCLSIIKLF